MKKIKYNNSFKTLRKKAEAHIKNENKKNAVVEKVDKKQDSFQLQVQAVELELQNDELRRVNEVLEQEKTKYSSLYDHSSIGYFTVNQAAAIINLNNSAAALIGLNKKYLLNKNIRLFVDENSRKDFDVFLTKIFYTNKKQECEVKLLTDNQNPTIVYIEALRMDHEDYCCLNVLNISDEKKWAQDIEVKNSELEAFAYTVAHDLKNPLTTIKGFCGVLLENKIKFKDKELEGYLELIIKSADTMESFLNAILRISKIGKVKESFVTVSLQDIIDTSNQTLKQILNDNKATLKLADNIMKTSNNLKYIYCDRYLILEVFQNLIVNSLKYRDPNVAPIIEIGYDLLTNGEPAYYVKDNGKGLNIMYLSKIFDLFEKLDNQASGSGAGLAIVKRIIQRHGGIVWAESKGLGFGLKVLFTVPKLNNEVIRNNG